MESIQCKFPHRDGSRAVEDHSVGFTDGQTKVLIMIAIVLFCKELEFGEKEMQNLQLRHVLKSFESVRCSYKHFDNPARPPVFGFAQTLS